MTGRNEDTDIERGASDAPRGNPDHDPSDIREERPEDPAEEPVQEPPD